MLNFLAQNWGTLFVGALIIAIIVLVVIKLRRDHKKGTSPCGCGCDNCPSSGMCHKNRDIFYPQKTALCQGTGRFFPLCYRYGSENLVDKSTIDCYNASC